MPSERKVITFRPDAEENRLIGELQQRTGLPQSRVIGLALREMGKVYQVPAPTTPLIVKGRPKRVKAEGAV